MATNIKEVDSAFHGFMKFLRFGILFTLLLSVFFVLPGQTVFAQTTGSISGTVRGLGGTPLAGVNVSVQNFPGYPSNWDAVTATDGTYTITGVPAGSNAVRALSSGFSQQFYNNADGISMLSMVTVTGGGTTSNIDFNLVAGGTIRGTIRGPGGIPVSNAVVIASDKVSGAWVFTASADDGTYTLESLPSGSYVVYMSMPSSMYVPLYYKYADNSDTATPVYVTSGGTTSNIDFDLAVGGTISGTVRGPGGTPVEGAFVIASRDNHQTGFSSAADGTYTIRGLPAGSFVVHVVGSNGFSSQFYNHANSFSTATPVSVTSGGATSNIDFNQVASGGTIQGRITLHGGLPCPSCLVEVLDAASGTGNTYRLSLTSSSSDGSYSSGLLPTGSYKVRADAYNIVALRPIGYSYWPATTNIDDALLVPVTTGAATPNINIEVKPFIFTDQTGVPLSTVVTSHNIFVTWINADATASISITGGEYSVNGAAYTSAPRTVGYRNSVKVRLTSSSSYGTTTNATLTIGGISDTFSVTTIANTPPVIPTPPTGGIQGASITINGSNFGAVQGGSYVDFNGVRGTVVYWSDTEIGVIVPPGATSGSMRVVTSHGGASSNMSFTVYPPTCIPVKVAGNYYYTIQDAYNNATTGSTIQITEGLFNTGNLDFNRNISTRMDGGYNCEYNAKTGYSTVDGTVTIKGGSVTVNGLIIK